MAARSTGRVEPPALSKNWAMNEPTVEQILATASGAPSLELRLPILLPLHKVPRNDPDWAEGMTTLAWTYRAMNDQVEATACARLVITAEAHDSIWKHKCVVIWCSIEASNNRAFNVAELQDAAAAMERNGESEAMYEAANLLASELCNKGQFAEAEKYAMAAFAHVERMRSEYEFDGYCFPPLVRCYQKIAWVQSQFDANFAKTCRRPARPTRPALCSGERVNESGATSLKC